MIKDEFYDRLLFAEGLHERLKQFHSDKSEIDRADARIKATREAITFVFGDSDAEIDENLKRYAKTGSFEEHKPIEKEFDPMYIPILRGLISYHERLRLVAETKSPGEGMNDLYLGAIKLSLRLMEERFGSTG